MKSRFSFIRGAAFVVLCLLVGLACGCRSVSGYPKQPVKTGAEVKALSAYFSPDVFKTFHDKDGLAEKMAYRNEVTEGRLRAVNLYYLQLERALTTERNVENMGVDFAVIGTSLAASIVGGAETKSVLALISGGLVAAKGSVDKNLFYEKTMPALVAQMRAGRATVLAKIRKGLELDPVKYSLATALDDVDEYAAAGSIPGAINGVVVNAGAETKEARYLFKGVMISTYEDDANADKLSKFWMPDGKTPKADNQEKLNAELAKRGIPEDELPTVISFPEFKPLRAELVKALGL